MRAGTARAIAAVLAIVLTVLSVAYAYILASDGEDTASLICVALSAIFVACAAVLIYTGRSISAAEGRSEEVVECFRLKTPGADLSRRPEIRPKGKAPKG